MKNIIFIAPPNAGKGTQSGLVSKKYNLAHISTGDLLRESAAENTEFGRSVQEKMNKGQLISDDIMIEMLKNRLLKEDCANGYILDGFPRTLVQLEMYKELLKELGRDFGVAISLEIPYEMLVERVVGRLTCPNCKKIFNLSYHKMIPKVEGKCDDCNSELTKREDDNEETLKKRYQTYLDNTMPLIEEFEKMGVLYKVDAGIDRDTTFASVEAIIND